MNRRLRSLFITTTAMAVLLVPTGIAVAKRQQLADWLQLRQYVPPVNVEVLATETAMSSTGRRIFYVNHPSIQDKSSFYTSCNENEHTVVLGCYVSGQGIYVLNVNDERLRGVQQVTAAHEMLHAAYSRLGKDERQHVDQLLQASYANLHNSDISEKIGLYQQNNADIVNELHSILGTEVASLSPELETYYQRYFTNRAKVVNYATAYKDVFTSRKQQLDAYDKQLQDIEKQVTTNNDTLDARAAVLEQEQRQLSSLRTTNRIDEYNAGVAPYNAKVAAYNRLVNENKQLVATYKTTLDARNKVAEEAQELSKALDSRIATRDSK